MTFPHLCAVLAALALSGCGGSKNEQTTPIDPVARTAEAGDTRIGTEATPREVRIEVGDHMKFSVTRIEAAAGETLQVLLINRGSAPKEAMGHNWVLLRPGVDVTAYANAALGAKVTDYLPTARAADVLAHTKLLGGGAKDAVVFTVPAEATAGSEFVFLCTFPAHLQLGMKGVLTVR